MVSRLGLLAKLQGTLSNGAFNQWKIVIDESRNSYVGDLKCSYVVFNLAESFSKKEAFFDNFFPTLSLIQELDSRGYQVLCTMRWNRIKEV